MGLGNIYELAGANPEQHKLMITSGEREAAAKVFHKVFREVVYQTGKNFFLALETENAPIRETMELYEEMGCVMRYLPVNEKGELTVQILEEYYTPKAGVLAISWANALTGVIHPMEEIADFCKRKGIILYVQGSEMFAKLFMQLEEMNIDYFSFAADIFHGPKGVGGLFMKGKGFQVENVPGLLGMGVAAKEVLDFMDGMNTETAYLRAVFEEELAKRVPNVHFFGREARRLPNVCAFAVPGIHGELLAFRLSQKNLMVSYGGGRTQKLEHILHAMNVRPMLAKAAVSV